jgi:pimeloyl-ACP methyl ester carboxylesterase
LQYLKVNGTQLEYRWIGPQPAESPTLVFLHEGLGCAAMWRDFPERVVEATGLGALVYSRAGYGNSDRIDLPRPISFMHDEALLTLPRVLDMLDIRDAILLGHSDGGSIALIHAGGAEAGRVRGLILEAPHVFVEEFGLRSIRAAGEAYRNGDLKQKLERYHGTNVDVAFWGWNEVWLNPQFADWNIEKYLPRIKVPILVIQGEDDQYGTWRHVEAIEDSAGGLVRSLLVRQCGHSPHREQPEKTMASVVSFLHDELGFEL